MHLNLIRTSLCAFSSVVKASVGVKKMQSLNLNLCYNFTKLRKIEMIQ